MKIQRAIDWDQVSIDLSSQMNGIGYNPDLVRMHLNIGKMVTELSKLEVNIRRTGKFEILDDRVAEINKAINHFGFTMHAFSATVKQIHSVIIIRILTTSLLCCKA